MRDFQRPGRSPAFAANGMCATSHPLAAKVAVSTLEAGGNAVDAAIAGAAMLCVCEPHMTGLGGDLFALVKPAGTEDIVALNGSGRAPAGLDAAALRDRGLEQMPEGSAHAVTVPGSVDAICALASEYGLLELGESLAPAIRYAEEGVPVAPRVARDWKEAAGTLAGAARDRYLEGGAAPAAGRLFRHAPLAEVMRRIAAGGRAAFYEGEVAEDMVASLRALGGAHALDDFAATECAWGAPIRGAYKGVELVEHPPNGQGATALLMNSILAEFDLPGMDPWGSRRAHVEAEAAKLAYDARNRFVADMDHVERLDHMLAPETARRLAALIDPARAMPDPAQAAEAVHRDTVYITVVDRDRMAVSLIHSLYHGFGSGIASEKFGLLLHNRGLGFTLEEGHPNEAGGGKRPMHTIIPAALAEGGHVSAVFGVMGGAYQPTGHARVVTNMVDYGLGPQAAIDGPRSFWDAGETMLEAGYGDDVRRELSEMGHKVAAPEVGLGGGQMIRIDREAGVLEGASDPRKDGCAIGY